MSILSKYNEYTCCKLLGGTGMEWNRMEWNSTLLLFYMYNEIMGAQRQLCSLECCAATYVRTLEHKEVLGGVYIANTQHLIQE